MEEVYCPRCKKPVGFPFMKCPECKWIAAGDRIEERKKLAYQYIQNDPENEEQDLMVLDMVLEEVMNREEKYSEVREKEFKNLSGYTFGKYMKINVGLIILPYAASILSLFTREGGIIELLLEDPVFFVIGSTILSAFFIGINTFLFFMARTKLFFMKKDG